MGDVERLHDVVGQGRAAADARGGRHVLRVGRTTVYALMKAGDLRPVHIGRSCRISHAELERYVAPARRSPADVPRSFAGTPANHHGPARTLRPHSTAARRRVMSTSRLPVSGPSATLSSGHEHRGVADGGTRVERRVDDLQGRRRALARLRLRRLQARRQARPPARQQQEPRRRGRRRSESSSASATPGRSATTSTPTVAAWLEHWLTTIAPRRVRQRTLESYESAVRKHLIPGIGRHRLDRLRPEHLDQLYTPLLDDGYSPASVLRAPPHPVPGPHGRDPARPRRPQRRQPWSTRRAQRAERHRHRARPRRGPRRPRGGRRASATPPAGRSPWPSACASPRRSRCSGRTSTCSPTPSRSGAASTASAAGPDLRGAQDPAQPAHPGAAAAARRRAAPAQGRPARRADAGRLRVARRGPGLRPGQRPADRQEDRLRRLDARCCRRPASGTSGCTTAGTPPRRCC